MNGIPGGFSSSLRPETAKAWRGTLLAGGAVTFVVWALLEQLRRSVGKVERSVNAVWTSGQRLARNTQTVHLLGSTIKHGSDLAVETNGTASGRRNV